MVLNGIGGRTIDEAKRRLTFDEAVLWNAYIQKRGSLHIGRRVEISGAIVASMLSRVHGGKSQFLDFAIHEREKEPQIGSFVRAFGALKMTREEIKANRKKRR